MPVSSKYKELHHGRVLNAQWAVKQAYLVLTCCFASWSRCWRRQIRGSSPLITQQRHVTKSNLWLISISSVCSSAKASQKPKALSWGDLGSFKKQLSPTRSRWKEEGNTRLQIRHRNRFAGGQSAGEIISSSEQRRIHSTFLMPAICAANS